MKRDKIFKALLIILIAVLITNTFLNLFCSKVSAQSGLFSGISFFVDSGAIFFFDSSTGKIYHYNLTTGRLSKTYVLKELGRDLAQSRD